MVVVVVVVAVSKNTVSKSFLPLVWKLFHFFQCFDAASCYSCYLCDSGTQLCCVNASVIKPRDAE